MTAKVTARERRLGLNQEHGLLRTLVHATYWLDDGLQAYMLEHAGLSLPRAQSMAMIYLTEGVDRPSDLAEKLRVSKQATQQVLKALASKDILTLEPDPDNGRQKHVVFTKLGRELGEIARQGLFALEAELSKRIGIKRVLHMREALDEDWGEPPGC
ncbi:MAG: MarR family transcriptional regulator [Pseudomonadales bacterium]